jgi:hypothetical protein
MDRKMIVTQIVDFNFAWLDLHDYVMVTWNLKEKFKEKKNGKFKTIIKKKKEQTFSHKHVTREHNWKFSMRSHLATIIVKVLYL